MRGYTTILLSFSLLAACVHEPPSKKGRYKRECYTQWQREGMGGGWRVVMAKDDMPIHEYCEKYAEEKLREAEEEEKQEQEADSPDPESQ